MNKNKTAFITGASSGIGKAFTRLFAKKGYDLIITARSEDVLKDLKEEIENVRQVSVSVMPADLSSEDEVKKLLRDIIEADQRIDVLVNNAGFGASGGFLKSTDWDKESDMIAVNITAVTLLSKVIGAHMKKRGAGHIINIGSIASFLPGPFLAVYYASKSYVLSFSEGLSAELSGTGVSVTCVCPGPVKTDFKQTANVGKTNAASFWDNAATPESIAEFGFAAMKKGKTVAIPGLQNKVLVSLLRFLPRRLVRFLARKLQAPKNFQSKK